MRVLLLGVLLIVSTLLPAAGQGTSVDQELTAGIAQVKSGDYLGAVVTLDRVIQHLKGDTSRSNDLAQADLYLGWAYVALGAPEKARATFRDAFPYMSIQRLRAGEKAETADLTLPSETFPQKVLAAFEEAKREAGATRGGTETNPPQPAAFEPQHRVDSNEPVRATIGVDLAPLDEASAERLHAQNQKGVLVRKVFEGGQPSRPEFARTTSSMLWTATK